jgi:hypothetical protein
MSCGCTCTYTGSGVDAKELEELQRNSRELGAEEL